MYGHMPSGPVSVLVLKDQFVPESSPLRQSPVILYLFTYHVHLPLLPNQPFKTGMCVLSREADFLCWNRSMEKLSVLAVKMSAASLWASKQQG